MNWSEDLSQAINYIEANIERDIDVKAVGRAAAISPFYLQRGFNILTGYSLGEYIRCRRLYLAALDIHNGGKVVDIAAKYGYSTQESFTKAFRRFHGISPSKIASNLSNIKMFMPIDIKLQVSGGGALDEKIIDVNALDIVGYKYTAEYDTAFNTIPALWDEYHRKKVIPLFYRSPQTVEEKTICDCLVGEYGVRVDDIGNGKNFHYIIGGKHNGTAIPSDMTLIKVKPTKWAVFSGTGPLPGVLQSINNKIYAEWLPQADLDLDGDISIEHYGKFDENGTARYVELWIPVKKKERSQ